MPARYQTVILALAALLALAPATPARAADLARGVQSGAMHTYEIRNRFTAGVAIPERGSFRTEVEMTMRAAIRVMSTQGGGYLLRLRIEALDFEFREVDVAQLLGLRFSSADPPESDAGNQAASLRQLIGETFEVFVEPDRTVRDIILSVHQKLPQDNAGNLMRRFIRETLLANSLLWIHWIHPDDAETPVGGSWTNNFAARVIGDGDARFRPLFTLDALDNDTALMSIGGDATFVDGRTAGSRLDGQAELEIRSSHVSGAAAWNTGAHLLETLDLTAIATLQQKRKDPLGMRIEHKTVEHEYAIRRIR